MLSAWISFKRAKKRSRRPLWIFVALAFGAAALAAKFWFARTPVPAERRAPLPRSELQRLAILVFKSERSVEVWAQYTSPDRADLLREYPIAGLSGGPGPKLREGDKQIPEGVYRLKRLKDNALELDFPNEFDMKMARKDGRMKLGGGIAITASGTAPGSIALGDAAFEDLTAVTTSAGPSRAIVILAPNDLRQRIPVRNIYLKLPWLDDFYVALKRELEPFNKPSPSQTRRSR